MKKIRGILVILFCALGFTLSTPKTNAISIVNVNDFACEGNDNYTYKLQYVGNFTNVFVRNFPASSSDKYDVLLSFNSSKQPYRCFLNALNSQNPAFMGYYRRRDGYLDLRNYDINYNLLESDIPFSGVLGDFSGSYVPLTNIWLANNNYVLYNDDLSHTLQYIGNYKVRDYILWVDPLKITYENESYDNFYLISIPKRKAWSMKLTGSIIQDIFYGNLDSYDFKTFDYTSSYSLLQTTDTTIFPKNSVYMNNSKSYLPNDIGFTYSKDLDFVSPDFGDSSDSIGGYIFPDMTAWNNYQSCEREMSFQNFVVNSWIDCRKDYTNGVQDYTGFRAVNDFIQGGNIWNENLTGELDTYFNGIELSYNCNSLLWNSIYLVRFYNVIGKDPEYYFDVMSRLKYITQPNPNNIESVCGSRPAVPEQYQGGITNSSNVCNLDSWANIINCFKFGSSDVSDGSGSNTYFGQTVDNIRGLIQGAFESELLSPITTSYNSGLNLVQGGLTCDVNSTLLDIPYIDYVVYILGIVIFFLLFSFL